MSVSVSHWPPQASVKHLIRQFDPGCPSHPQQGLHPAKWMDVPFDIMREVCHITYGSFIHPPFTGSCNSSGVRA